MKLTLVCEEGFSYSGWQMVSCTIHSALDYEIAAKIKQLWNESREEEDECWMYCDGPHLFVLSGESLTLADVADAIQTLLKENHPSIEVWYKDEDAEVERVN